MSEKEVRELFAKTQRSLRAAERLLRDGDYDFAVSRAYYAMFYAACALLLTRNVRRTKHAGVLGAFNAEFIQTGELPRDLFAVFRAGFEDRAEGDDGLTMISQDQAASGIEGARQFVDAIGRRLAGILGGGS